MGHMKVGAEIIAPRPAAEAPAHRMNQAKARCESALGNLRKVTGKSNLRSRGGLCRTRGMMAVGIKHDYI